MKTVAFILLVALFAEAVGAENLAWNVSASPLRFVVGPNVRVDRRVSDRVSLGLFGSWSDHAVKAVYFNGAEVGGAATYAFDGALSDGWFVESALKYDDLRVEVTSSEGDVYLRHLVNWGARAVGGYRWYWYGFNLGVEAGLEGNSEGGKSIYNSTDNRDVKIPLYTVAFYGDLSLGFAF